MARKCSLSIGGRMSNTEGKDCKGLPYIEGHGKILRLIRIGRLAMMAMTEITSTIVTMIR